MTVKSISVSTSTNKIAELNDALKQLKRSSLYVGIRKGTDRKDGSHIDQSDLAILHELGSSDGRIPARPFLIPSVTEQKDAIAKAFGKAMKAALANDEKQMNNILEATGIRTAVEVTKYIMDSSHFVPDKPETIKRKSRNGTIKEKPLIDTGDLKGSITSFVIKE